jgi:hypothetical protein
MGAKPLERFYSAGNKDVGAGKSLVHEVKVLETYRFRPMDADVIWGTRPKP